MQNERNENGESAAVEILKQIVVLVDAGITPQITRGQWREEQDFKAAIAAARKILGK